MNTDPNVLAAVLMNIYLFMEPFYNTTRKKVNG